MKNINTYIFEKLKVSFKDNLITYLEFYNKIQKYCKSNACKNFAIDVNDNKSLPEFLYEDNFVITNIWPVEGGDVKKLIFRISNLKETNFELYTIEVTNNEDKLVDFITQEWVDKIMKYLSVY